MSQIINVLKSFIPVFSSVVQVNLGLPFKSLFKSVKINSLLMSPICCGKWSQKKSEYSNPLEMLCLITVRCSQFLEDLTTI